jgi:hypothetical protein
MYIRRTQTRNTTTGERYFTHRLVRSQRVGDKVRQVTVLNLGRHFAVAQADWPIVKLGLRSADGTTFTVTPMYGRRHPGECKSLSARPLPPHPNPPHQGGGRGRLPCEPPP